ncbi:hypothetical protein BU16DRAFT_524583 [Lophium mytilinum]|uniref:Uncharacterized protein n=1 Tax=Lophium mytilinum TaxID=390894 RepID=A0A6A6R3H9_9PEZI|nr:hypothetical protein BU16DRAFT_524583 [Lophium mytilinum]
MGGFDSKRPGPILPWVEEGWIKKACARPDGVDAGDWSTAYDDEQYHTPMLTHFSIRTRSQSSSYIPTTSLHHPTKPTPTSIPHTPHPRKFLLLPIFAPPTPSSPPHRAIDCVLLIPPLPPIIACS